MKPIIKICGLANSSDVEETMKLSPDAIGFIFWPKSPRAVDAESVAEWTNHPLANGILKVGVFVDTPVQEVHSIAQTAGLDVIQLHGPYTAEEIQSFSLPVWRVLHVDRLPEDWNRVPVSALLIDSGTVDLPGGTGIRVNTEKAIELIQESNFPVLLAGGLKADTVADIIQEVTPDGVDVSSGVEDSPGKKDLEAVQAFVTHARTSFSTLSR